MSTPTASLTAPARPKLTSPYNLSHPDSRCAARGKNRTHKFKTVFRGPLVNGIRKETSRCQHCGAEHESTVDYGLLAKTFTA